MPNLMYSEFYKLRKSKSFYICGIVMIVFVLLVYGTLFLMNKAQQEHVENGSYEVTVTVENAEENAPVWDSIEILDVEQQMFGGFAGIIIAVFAGIFVIGEYGNGAMKNITGKGYARWKIFLAKYIATGVAVILLLLFMVFAVVLFGIIFKGTGGLTGEFFKNLCVYTGIQLLLGTALTGIMVTISELCRNLGAGISISICVVIFSTTLTSALDLLFRKLQFQPSGYWLLNLVEQCPVTGIGSRFLVRMAASVIFWMALSLIVGVWHFQKTDVK